MPKEQRVNESARACQQETKLILDILGAGPIKRRKPKSAEQVTLRAPRAENSKSQKAQGAQNSKSWKGLRSKASMNLQVPDNKKQN